MQEQIEVAVAEFLIEYGIAHKLCPFRYGDDSVKMEKELPLTATRKQQVSAMVSVEGGDVLVEGGVEIGVEIGGGFYGLKGETFNPCGELLGPGWAPFPKIVIPLADPAVFDKLTRVLDERFTQDCNTKGAG